MTQPNKLDEGIHYSGTFESSFAKWIGGDVTVKNKTMCSALGIITYRSTFRKNLTIEFPFLVRDDVMKAQLSGGQIITFTGADHDGKIKGTYVSVHPHDAGTFDLTRVESGEWENITTPKIDGSF
jgi:hypothetical protein